MGVDKSGDDFFGRKLQNFLKSRGLDNVRAISSLNLNLNPEAKRPVIGDLEYQVIRKSAKDEIEGYVFYFLRHRKNASEIRGSILKMKTKMLSKIDKKISSLIQFISSKRSLSFENAFDKTKVVLKGGDENGLNKKKISTLTPLNLLDLEDFLGKCHIILKGKQWDDEDASKMIHFAEEMLFVLKRMHDDLKGFA